MIKTIGFAGGAAANNLDTALGPWYWYYHPELFVRTHLQWLDMIVYTTSNVGHAVYPDLKMALKALSKCVQKHYQTGEPLLLLGGDHSIAMGTWPVLANRCSHQLGLLWIDAHLDCHTPDSSFSKNYHGMPLAYLLGRWGKKHVFAPQQICLLGCRSYEQTELAYLKSSGVKIIMMDEILQKGLSSCLQEAISYLKKNVQYLGVSIDLDAFDPNDCPGVGCREKNGIDAQEFFDFFQRLPYKEWVAIEVAEFNPLRDIEQKTARWLPKFLNRILGST